ncbi:MAG: peptide ABC transporter ATP-binding protein [Cyanobacteria bacterium PR.023]|jgi:oligopeptide/dipeptide ABC transporter ATP-binding protein|nr:peptide ABC transporter ATP-binding protein [Cyanobacteria bacterium PR.023]MDQ5933523.1 oligopeptide transport system ATP-binding protein [Cyanobacteriota bacterium erpe_2018_sw_21hr_WHONDRS-SW48-000092_B_bin.40]
MALLEIQNLATAFPTEAGMARAVDDVTLSVDKGKVLGIVGESGCGKSITSLSILRLIPPPGKIVGGQIRLDGKNLLDFSEAQMRGVRGNRIALIPQDPMTSLNPVYTVGAQIMEAVELHQKVSKAEARKKAIDVLDRVRIPEARNRVDDYPHQFSGGMRQRVMIAMALACEPELLIADEPTTALDVTVQAQILDLLREIQKDQGTAIVLITHDLGVVAEMCDTVAVMYAGSVVEYATVQELFQNPKHPYTIGLMNSLPKPGSQRLIPIEGQPPSLVNLPKGCRFANRCSLRVDSCESSIPPLEEKSAGHDARCFLVEKEV